MKTKVSLKTLSKLLLSITKVFVRKGKGPSWGSSSTFPTYLATSTGQVENAVGERKLDQVNVDKLSQADLEVLQRGTFGFPKREQERAVHQLFGLRDEAQANRCCSLFLSS